MNENFKIEYGMSNPEDCLNYVYNVPRYQEFIRKKDKVIWSIKRRWKYNVIATIAALVLAVISSVLLEGQFYRNYVCACLVIFAMFVFLLGCSEYRSFKQASKTVLPKTGHLLISADGIFDNQNDGSSAEHSWTEFDFAVVGDKVIILFFKTPHPVAAYYPSGPETETVITTALTHYGKSEYIYKRRFK